MRGIMISFCEDMSSAANPDEIRSGSIFADFTEETLFFSNDPMFEQQGPRKNRCGVLCCDRTIVRQFRRKISVWIKNGISASRHKHFNSIPAFNAWRQEVYFEDHEIGWQFFLVNDDGDFDVYISFNLWLPAELEDIYTLVKSVRR